ncbi:DUF1028 domain-containing protein [Bacillaceae bacterium S4-13-56]
MKERLVATFSIVGFDPETGELGIAVQSKFIGVGAVVPWAKAGVGAVATQSYANTSFGPNGLKLIENGLSAQGALDRLLSEDDDREFRQVGIVDAKGNVATFTGAKCYDWAGGITGKNFAAQGNILVGQETVQSMADTFTTTQGTLSERLLKALDSGQASGGDSRGKQSAALYVVKEKGGYGGYNDHFIDLRVDDHPEPIKELIRLYELQQLYFGQTKPENIKEINGPIKSDLVSQLLRWGYLEEDPPTDDALFEALTRFVHTENFEEREQDKGKIDLEVLKFMENKSR